MNEAGMGNMLEEFELISSISRSVAHGGIIEAVYQRTGEASSVVLTAERKGTHVVVTGRRQDAGGEEQVVSRRGRNSLMGEIERLWDEHGLGACGQIPFDPAGCAQLERVSIKYRDGHIITADLGEGCGNNARDGFLMIYETLTKVLSEGGGDKQ